MFITSFLTLIQDAEIQAVLKIAFSYEQPVCQWKLERRNKERNFFLREFNGLERHFTLGLGRR